MPSQPDRVDTAHPASAKPGRSVGRGRRAGRDRAAVLAAAADVVARRGVAATRFTDVAEAASVPVSTLQYAFGSREDLLIAAFHHAWSTERAVLDRLFSEDRSPWEQTMGLVRAGLAGFDNGDVRGRLWFESVGFGLRDDEVRDDVLADYRSWRELLARAIARGVELHGWTPVAGDPARAAIAVLALIDGLGLAVALGDPAVAAEAVDDIAPAVALLVGRPEAV